MASSPKSGAKDPATKTLDVNEERRQLLIQTTTVFGAAGAACVAYPFIKTLSPNRDVQAAATLEVDLTTIPEGTSTTVLWQGKPVFIWHRNAEQIAQAAEDDATAAMDPEADAARVQRPEWLVVMGVCTHLGCVPMKGGEYGGWRCPCHGSQFDNSGRVRHGPAGTNLPVPPYTFVSNDSIVIG
ncbi:MAG: ubiquinol-cytochrome c reductase iron-sulfur subunit [Alphaproteobacteria bacterium CG_4_10_14_0_8_um_filter_53_9]|nr:MAG: ubiquinol-cytochrome c reductase iron-sulfur subunit [Alphaproteobacteria bacterium CG_4_10_14_0_8_um_filter_53_9]